MTDIFTHQTCHLCGHKGCMTVWDTGDKKTFKCHSCGESGVIKEDYVPKDLEIINSNTQPDISDPYVPGTYRGINKETLEKVGAWFTRNNDTGDETVHWQYPSGIKHRQLPKTIRITGRADNFFGAGDYTGGKYVTLTEGEEDRCSAMQMLGLEYPVLSFPNATPSPTFWENARKELQKFDRIIVSADNDEAGQKLAQKVYRMFPGRVYLMDHGKYKDANDFLQDGAIKNYRDSFWNAKRLKPNNILSTAEDFIDLFEKTPDYQYFQTGIGELDDKMLGIHKGALTVVLAETGIGKTEFFRYLEWQAFNTTKYKIAFCHGEETQLRSVLGLFSYWMERNLTRKDLVEEGGYTENYKEFVQLLTEEQRVHQFTVRVDEGVDEIVDQVRFLVEAMDVDYIFLEPIQDFVAASNTTEKESLLTDLTVKLKRLAPELNVGIVIIAHSNKEGEAKYAASIVQGAAYEIRLSRNTDADDPVEKNTTHVTIGRKNRTGGGNGPAGTLYFDFETYTMKPDWGPKEEYNK